MIGWVISGLLAAGIIPACRLGSSPYGQLQIRELPGFVWVVLAGREYRRRACKILAERRHKCRPARRHPVWLCGYCSVTRTQPGRFCGECGSGMTWVTSR